MAITIEPLVLQFGPLNNQTWGSTPPSASTDLGPYKAGDVQWNTAPVAGGPVGWSCTTAGANGSTAVHSPFFSGAPASAFASVTNTTGFQLTAAQITGGTCSVDVALVGALGGAANVQLPTVANLVAAIPGAVVGTSYRLRIINESSGAYTWTVTTATGWTLTGTVTIAQNTWREFVVTLTSLTAATLQNVAVGTFS